MSQIHCIWEPDQFCLCPKGMISHTSTLFDLASNKRKLHWWSTGKFPSAESESGNRYNFFALEQHRKSILWKNLKKKYIKFKYSGKVWLQFVWVKSMIPESRKNFRNYHLLGRRGKISWRLPRWLRPLAIFKQKQSKIIVISVFLKWAGNSWHLRLFITFTILKCQRF